MLNPKPVPGKDGEYCRKITAIFEIKAEILEMFVAYLYAEKLVSVNTQLTNFKDLAPKCELFALNKRIISSSLREYLYRYGCHELSKVLAEDLNECLQELCAELTSGKVSKAKELLLAIAKDTILELYPDIYRVEKC